MILGIDVGGTHTDAVVISDHQIQSKAKVLTDAGNIMGSLIEATEAVMRDIDPAALRRVVLSTTISTNAIVQGKTEAVGIIAAAGPGLPPALISPRAETRFVSGYINHRGLEAAPIDEGEIRRCAREFKEGGIAYAGVVGKFSTRNPSHELKIRDLITDGFRHISLGHRLSGHLNFPRRLATTYLNSAIWGLYENFVRAVTAFVERQGIKVPIYILKADGGTIEIGRSVDYPVQTILSGPAASIMGILSMTGGRDDAVALDIGGTTTDIALFADGVPLLEALGVTIEGHKTLIRGLRTRSIGVGGDSAVRLDGGRLEVGPRREGPAAALGGPCPTPTDAMIVLGLTDIGDRQKARHSLEPLAAALGCAVEEAARAVFGETVRRIAEAVRSFTEEINNRPVYTIHEMLEGKKIEPRIVYVVGGPAQGLAPALGKALECPYHIPENAEVANAVGAALARTTAEVTILADTERRFLTVGEMGLQMEIPGRFSKEDAIRIGRERLKETALAMGASEDELEMETVEEQEFNMVRDFYTAGKNIRVKVQIKPGLISPLGG
ncbi:MAG TPA: hydantoinase/oxoprolinase family protein [Syntrophales bacterium]|nr:hydantoinase/oxoprolinase family protein [Syntrophales bacterium]HOM07872.1 hydantoinase/oxoprolinase family protein [Syntrophales bacterium]HOO00267.1 hydantoinase/oxoprolinase family protein [Syntrophales bacterium]HPC01766.1 hydantoinase/oxoprolinase family protein [Syntrophales bacterium]HPQ07363.1 hydantoinase/oxoprolinase family protein [Syntrophales bacterium]